MRLLASVLLWSERPCVPEPTTNVAEFSYNTAVCSAVPGAQRRLPAAAAAVVAHAAWARDRGLVTAGSSASSRLDKSLLAPLREVERLMFLSRVVTAGWASASSAQILLENGTLIGITTDDNLSDIAAVLIDKTVSGMRVAETIADAAVADRLVLLTYKDTGKCSVIASDAQPVAYGRKLKALSGLGASHVAVRPGGKPGRDGARVACNVLRDAMLVWWPAPSPQLHNNCIVLRKLAAWDVLCEFCTEGEVLAMDFSAVQPMTVHSIEKAGAIAAGPQLTHAGIVFAEERARHPRVHTDHWRARQGGGGWAGLAAAAVAVQLPQPHCQRRPV